MALVLGLVDGWLLVDEVTLGRPSMSQDADKWGLLSTDINSLGSLSTKEIFNVFFILSYLNLKLLINWIFKTLNKDMY